VCRHQADIHLSSPEQLVPSVPVVFVLEMLTVLIVRHYVGAQLIDQVFCLV
jgi:hypothetical protein